MARVGSLPYLFILTAIGIGVSVLLWVILDSAIAEVVVQPTWSNGSQQVQRGRESALAMWDYALVMLVTSSAMTILIASRRGGRR